MMQNRYTADVGDFGKYGMLKNVCPKDSGLRLGINWYLVRDETHNNDGKHATYLDDRQIKKVKKFKVCDEVLYNQLQTIVREKTRFVKEIEKRNILPKDTNFYSDLLTYEGVTIPEEKLKSRHLWAMKGLMQLSHCDVVFFDPDNGLEVKSIKKHSDKGVKYVYLDEIIDYFKRGQSLIIYNHRCRERREIYEERFKK